MKNVIATALASGIICMIRIVPNAMLLEVLGVTLFGAFARFVWDSWWTDKGSSLSGEELERNRRREQR